MNDKEKEVYAKQDETGRYYPSPGAYDVAEKTLLDKGYSKESVSAMDLTQDALQEAKKANDIRPFPKP